MLREKWSNIAWGIIILCFLCFVFIGQKKIKEQNSILTNVIPRSEVQKDEEKFSVPDKLKFSGYVSEVGEDSISVRDASNNKHQVSIKELINSRTRDKISSAQISVGDYYKNGEITRNISGKELRNELILNMARTFNSSKLSVRFTRLKGMKVYEGYSTFKVRFYDGNYSLFGKEIPELFSIELKANENTVIYAKTGTTIFNLQKKSRDDALQERIFYIGIDESTLKDERPVVTSFELAD